MSKSTKDRAPPKGITKLIEEIGYRHDKWSIFSDFVEMAVISISNAVDLAQREKREARYMEIVKRYEPNELEQFPKMLGSLVMELEEQPTDVLGRVFHELDLHNKYTGQFFTPFTVCQMMAKMQVCDGFAQNIIEERGFMRASEPACGSGAMVIALASALKDEGINYQQHLHVTATDVDAKCVHMCFLQLSLLHIPAVIVHGNTLSMEEWGHWYTPAHIMGGWNGKLRQRSNDESKPIPDTVEPKKLEPPMPTVPTRQEPSIQAGQLSLF